MASNENILASPSIPAPPYGTTKQLELEEFQASQPKPLYMRDLHTVPLDRLGEELEIVECPFCQCKAKTSVERMNSRMTYTAGVVLALVTVIGACLPCLLGWGQDVIHCCGACGRQLTFVRHDGNVAVFEAAQKAIRARSVAPPQYSAASEQRPRSNTS